MTEFSLPADLERASDLLVGGYVETTSIVSGDAGFSFELLQPSESEPLRTRRRGLVRSARRPLVSRQVTVDSERDPSINDSSQTGLVEIVKVAWVEDGSILRIEGVPDLLVDVPCTKEARLRVGAVKESAGEWVSRTLFGVVDLSQPVISLDRRLDRSE